MAKELTAWLSIGSTYSYLTAMRIQEVCMKEDIKLSVVPISTPSEFKISSASVSKGLFTEMIKLEVSFKSIFVISSWIRTVFGEGL